MSNYSRGRVIKMYSILNLALFNREVVTPTVCTNTEFKGIFIPLNPLESTTEIVKNLELCRNDQKKSLNFKKLKPNLFEFKFKTISYLIQV